MAEGTTIQGLGGRVQIGAGTSWNMKIDSWSATFNYPTIETTGFTDAGHQVHEAVAQFVTGTCSGTITHDAANTAPIPGVFADAGGMDVGELANCNATVALMASGTGTGTDIESGYLIPAVIESFSLDRPNQGKATGTISFRSRGAPTQAWDET
mgnify:CR=1 FL=1